MTKHIRHPFSLFNGTLHEQYISKFMLSFVEAEHQPTAAPLQKCFAVVPDTRTDFVKSRHQIDLQDLVLYPPFLPIHGTEQKKWQPRGLIMVVVSHDSYFKRLWSGLSHWNTTITLP
jgi:hypothetical protein